MSISSSLSNAISGMNAASRMAEIVSSNVSNALTEGYGRRSLDLSAAVIGGQGAGVFIDGVTRHVDRGILADRRLADAALSGFDSLVSTLKRVEDVVGQAGDEGSISSRIVAVESALIDAAADPSSAVRLSALGDKLEGLAKGLNNASGAVQDMRAQADASIADQIDQLNTALSKVERLNADITYSRNSGNDPSALMDQRQRIVDEIAQIVPVRELDRDGGQVALMTPDGQMLIDGRAREFGFTANPVITAEMSFAGGELSGITLNGSPIAADGLGRLAGGTLGAAFQARDVELVSAQEGLDSIAADLINRLQDPTVDPSLVAGDPGLLTDNGAAFDPGMTVGLSGRISLNSAVDPSQGGTLTNLRDGINATAPGPSGDASLLQSISAAFVKPIAAPGSSVLQSAAGLAATFEADTGGRRLNLESELSFANARWTSLKEAEAANGVDTDFEMQMLLRVEQAYAANARVIQTVNTLMQRLMEI